MLHAIKPMIWQAMQTLKDPAEDAVKRARLQVLSHNLSAEGILSELFTSFDTYFPPDNDKVECKKYLDTAINDAVKTLQNKTEKEKKICVDRVHMVCWELCKVQLKGNFPSMLTETSTMIWWKIFNTFAERDNQHERILCPVTMDWEEVDYWANVVLKVMALPTNTQSRREREVMGSSALNFQDALIRFNAKLNEKNGMYVLDSAGKPDLAYVENSMQELNIRLFEGIHLSGSLLPVKKSHAKWCVLYQRGLAFADNPADVDSSNPRAFIAIGSDTEVTPIYDKSQRPVRFQLKSGKVSTPIVFEANNISMRNKWVTAIICLKYGKLPDYEKDYISRCKTRLRNREYEAEAKESMRKQKERTKQQVEAMKEAMEQEKQRHESEEADMRNATTEQLRSKIAEHDARMAALLSQMTELGIQYEQEKATMAEHHDWERQQLARQHGNQMGEAQTEWESEVARLREQLQRERDEHNEAVARKNATIAELEEEIARLKALLDSLTKEKEDSAERHRSESEQATAVLSGQQQANAQLRDEAESLTKAIEAQREKIQSLEEQQERSVEELAVAKCAAAKENAELKAQVERLEEQKHQLLATVSAKESAEKYYEKELQKYTQQGVNARSHRGPGFDVTVADRKKAED